MTVDSRTFRPVPVGLRPSFGFGDRPSLATPGHVEAMRRAGQGIAPIFPQQSIREMMRTRRRPEAVMQDAGGALAEAGWTADGGADADHLKAAGDVEATAAVGFTFSLGSALRECPNVAPGHVCQHTGGTSWEAFTRITSRVLD